MQTLGIIVVLFTLASSFGVLACSLAIGYARDRNADNGSTAYGAVSLIFGVLSAASFACITALILQKEDVMDQVFGIVLFALGVISAVGMSYCFDKLNNERAHLAWLICGVIPFFMIMVVCIALAVPLIF